jgi:hypothetical protein
MRTMFLVLAAAVCVHGQDTFTGVLYLTPGYTLTQTSGASVVSETVGRVLAQTNTFGTNGTSVAPEMNAWFSTKLALTNAEERVWSLDAITNNFGQEMDLFRVNLAIVKVGATTNDASVTVGDYPAHLGLFGATNQSAVVGNGGCLMMLAPSATGWEADSKVLRIVAGTNATQTVEVYLGGAK